VRTPRVGIWIRPMNEDGMQNRIPGVRNQSLTGPAVVEPDLLFSSQQTILKRVLQHIYEIAADEAKKELEDSKRYRGNQQHPHQVFLIDGARGSGKTTLLLTILHNLQYLGRPHKWSSATRSSKR
jgi:predicted ATP-dependent serine protease